MPWGLTSVMTELKAQIEELDDELQHDSKNKLTLQQLLDDKTGDPTPPKPPPNE